MVKTLKGVLEKFAGKEVQELREFLNASVAAHQNICEREEIVIISA